MDPNSERELGGYLVPLGYYYELHISTGAASGAKLSRLGVCCGGSTPTPPAPAAGYACSGLVPGVGVGMLDAH